MWQFLATTQNILREDNFLMASWIKKIWKAKALYDMESFKENAMKLLLVIPKNSGMCLLMKLVRICHWSLLRTVLPSQPYIVSWFSQILSILFIRPYVCQAAVMKEQQWFTSMQRIFWNDKLTSIIFVAWHIFFISENSVSNSSTQAQHLVCISMRNIFQVLPLQDNG